MQLRLVDDVREAAFSNLLRHLAASLGLDDDVEHATRVAASATWTDKLEAALPIAGMRASWVEGSLREISSLARPDLPLVAHATIAGDDAWIVLDGSRMGLVRVWSSNSWLPYRWYRLEEAADSVGDTRRRWARVEPILPALPSLESGSTPSVRLRALLRPERESVGVVVVFAIAVGVLSLAAPLAIQVLINWLAFGALYQPVVVLAGALLLCLTLAAGLGAAQRYAVELIQRRIFVRTVTDLGARLARVRLASLDGVHGPELVNRFFDVLTLQKATKTLLLDGLTAALQAGVGLLLLALYHPLLLLFDVVIVGLAAFALVPFFARAQETAIKESKVKYQVAAWMEEMARHPRVFKLGAGGLGEARLERLSRSYLASRDAHFQSFFRQYLGMQGVQVLVQVGLLLTCGYLVLEGQLTLGQLVAAEFIVASALVGLTKFTDKLETVYDMLAGVDKLGALMDLPHERARGALLGDAAKGAGLKLSEVGFRWPDGSRSLLRDASLDVEPGARIAVLGEAGSGKTVLADLMLGLREPTHGAILRDGVPLNSLLPDEAYAATMLVRTDSLVQASVYDNVTLGAVVPEQEVWAVLERLELSTCISRLPGALDAELSPTGSPLSEMQARALLLARALVRPPPLLVVDGVFDGLGSRLLPLLVDALPSSTTLIVLTEEAAVARHLDRTIHLHEGGLHARPRLTQL